MNALNVTAVDRIRAHLTAGRSITPATAQAVYGIIRLASAIEDLRAEGMDIDMVLKTDEVGKRYGEYRMRRDIKQGDEVQIARGHGFGVPSWVKKTKKAKVVGRVGDVAYVTFTRGDKSTTVPLNVKELVNAA